MTGPEIALTIAAGVAAGGLSAALGVGGGVMMVPFILLVLGEGQHLAEGTSLLVIVPTAIAGVYIHAKRGFVDFRAAAVLGFLGVVGSFAGAKLALALDADVLTILFGILVIVVGLDMIRRGIKERAQAT
jgi:uncharacterized protein